MFTVHCLIHNTHSFRMSHRVSSLLPRGVDSFSTDSRASTPGYSTFSTISEVSLSVPPELYIQNVLVDINAVRGSGSYGSVYVGSWHHSKIAAKKLHQIFFDHLVTPESKTGILRSFARETNMLIKLKHPNIVQFYGLYSSRSGSYELNSDTYLIQELMHCALDDRIRQSPPLTLRNVVNLALDVAGGLRYLHERPDPIIHRDLASKNILLSSTGVAKIADLGVAKILDETQTPQSRLPGTELYMPPEVKIAGMAYDTKVDIYSFGVVILEMAIGRDSKANEAFRVSPNNSIVLTPEIERRKQDFDTLGHHPLRDVILNCLSRRDDRPTAKAVAEQLTILCASKVYLACPLVPVIIVTTSSSNEKSNLKLLEDKVKTLEMEKEQLQNKLLARHRCSAEQHLDALMAENVHLQSQISQLITEGPKSLPELPSIAYSKTKSLLDSEVSLSVDQLHTLSELSLSSKADSSELKKLKKEVEKYKTACVEMDKKLKEARLELQKYNGRSDLGFRQELDLLRSECRQLQSQLDFTNREKGYLQSQLSAAMHSHRY